MMQTADPVELFGLLLARLAMDGAPQHVLVAVMSSIDTWAEWEENR